jgi:hypothetical protein
MDAYRHRYEKAPTVMRFKIPFDIFIQVPLFQCGVLIIGCYLIALTISLANTINANGTFQARHFRMNITMQGAHDLSLIESPSTLFDVAFSRSGCNISTHSNLSLIGSAGRNHLELAASLPTTTLVDAFSLKLNNETYQCDQIKVQLLGRSEGDSTWSLVGSSDFRLRLGGVRHRDGFVPCSGRYSFDYRLPWPLTCLGPLQSAFQALLCFSFSACGALRRPRLGAKLVVGCSLSLAAITAAAGVGFLALAAPSESISPLFQCASYLTIAAFLCFAREHLVEAATAWSYLLLLVRVLSDCVANADCPALTADAPFLPLICAAFGTVFLAARRAHVRASLGRACRARAALDAVWDDAHPPASPLPAGLARLHRSSAASGPAPTRSRGSTTAAGSPSPQAAPPAPSAASAASASARRASDG